MKNNFSHYLPLTEDQFSELWRDCLFIPDTNVLLHFYRYSPSTREELFEIFRSIEDRLWVPHQAANEYFRNRISVILTQTNMVFAVETVLRNLADSATTEISKINFKVHPFIDKNGLISNIQNHLNGQLEELSKIREGYPNYLNSDPILDTLDSIFNGRLGDAYPAQKLTEIYKEGKDRYDKKIPPGFKDADKTGDNERYGDLIIWFQIIDHASITKKPIIFISNDLKEDLVWIEHGSIMAPRPELREEISIKAGVDFHIYNSDRFMEYAREFLKVDVKQDAIDEVRDIREVDEDTQKRAEIKKQLNKEFSLDYIVRHSLATQDEILKLQQTLGMGANLNEIMKQQEALRSQLGTIYDIGELMKQRSIGIDAISAIKKFQDQQEALSRIFDRGPDIAELLKQRTVGINAILKNEEIQRQLTALRSIDNLHSTGIPKRLNRVDKTQQTVEKSQDDPSKEEDDLGEDNLEDGSANE